MLLTISDNLEECLFKVSVYINESLSACQKLQYLKLAHKKSHIKWETTNDPQKTFLKI